MSKCKVNCHCHHEKDIIGDSFFSCSRKCAPYCEHCRPASPTKSEECKEIPGFPGYFVNTIGEVFTNKHRVKGKRNTYVSGELTLLKQYIEGGGYPSVSLWIKGKSFRKRVHNLVALTFIVNTEHKPYVLHKDGNKNNNHVENLYWGNNSDNMKDAIRHGTHISGFLSHFQRAQGERASNSKLSELEVLDIRRKYQEGIPVVVLAKLYEVWPTTIRGIIKRKLWKHI